MLEDGLDVIALRSPKLAGHAVCEEPVAYLVDDLRSCAPGHGIVGLRFAFTLASRTGRSRFVAAFLRVRFADSRVCATEIRVEDAPAGRTSVSVPNPGVVGWLVGNPMGAEPIPDHIVAHVIAEVPLDIATLGGTMYVDTTSTTQSLAGTRRRHACSPAGKSFTLTPPPDWAAESRPVRVQSPTKGTAADRLQPPAVRLCFAVDIERFGRFTTAEGVRAQRRFAELLATARAHAGLDETQVLVQESGDGQFVVLPPGLDESVVLPRLVEGLRLALRETNADLNDHARLRLRVAFHRGHVSPAANGWTGDAVIAVHRLLDSDTLRESLVDTPGADAVFIVPEVLYHDIVAHRHGTLDPDEFDRVEVTAPTKGFSAPAWIHAPL